MHHSSPSSSWGTYPASFNLPQPFLESSWFWTSSFLRLSFLAASGLTFNELFLKFFFLHSRHCHLFLFFNFTQHSTYIVLNAVNCLYYRIKTSILVLVLFLCKRGETSSAPFVSVNRRLVHAATWLESTESVTFVASYARAVLQHCCRPGTVL